MRWMIPLLVGCTGTVGPAPEPLSDCSAADGDAYAYISGATIDGDTLTVPVAFGGGCEDHTLVVCWPSQVILDSQPPQLELDVWHDGNGDSCEAALEDVATVDLTPLKTLNPSPIQINIGDETLLWEF